MPPRRKKKRWVQVAPTKERKKMGASCPHEERKKCIIDNAIKIQESRKTDILHQKEELKLDNELSKIKL